MLPGCGWEEAVETNKENGFFNHSVNVVNSDVPIYCIWKQKEGINSQEFLECIDGPTGPGFDLNELMKICNKIDVTMMNEQTPYPRVFKNNSEKKFRKQQIKLMKTEVCRYIFLSYFNYVRL